jgi:uncharacterized protein
VKTGIWEYRFGIIKIKTSPISLRTSSL